MLKKVLFLLILMTAIALGDTVLAADTLKINCKFFLQGATTEPHGPLERLALIQYPIEGEQSYTSFMRKITSYVRLSKENGADIIVFPELNTVDLLDLNKSSPELMTDLELLARLITDKYFQDIQSLSREFNVTIVGGSIPRQQDNEIHNTCPIAFPNGELILQDKLYLTPGERAWGWKNGTKLNVIETKAGKMAVLICHDSEFPDISMRLAAHKPELLIIPSMTEATHGLHRVRWSSMARAVEQRAYVAVTGTVPHKEQNPNWPNAGQVVVTTPAEPGYQEGTLAEGDLNQNQIVFVDLDFNKLRALRNVFRVWPARDLTDRKDELNIEIKRPEGDK